MKPSCAWSLKDLEKVQPTGIKVMSTFSCGGGSSMGYKLAGCDVIAANDIDPKMAYHYKLNLNPQHYFLCPIGDLLHKELPDELYNLDILDGSPPCSTFSMAGSREKGWGKNKHFREGQAKQVLSDLFFDYLLLVEKLRPKVAIAENVKGMLIGNAKGYTKAILRRFKEIGYQAQVFLVNAADCGVPQRRERVFFVAVRNDIEAKKLHFSPTAKWISAKEATKDIKIANKEKLKISKRLESLWHLVDEGSFEKATPGKNFTQRKLAAKKPSYTLTASDSVYHWAEPRHLSLQEYKRLGTFPDDYQAQTENIGKYMIGMSVPPRMTEAVARAVCEQWLGVQYGTA